MLGNYGQIHESPNPDIPVYGTICRSGKEWTVTLKEKVTSTGSTITGSVCGYGNFPHEKYPGIPVIDFTGESFDRCFEALHIHDELKPQYDKGGPEVLKKFLNAHIEKGFSVIVI